MRNAQWHALPGGFGFPLGFAGGFVIVVATTALDDATRPVAAVAGLAVLVAAISALTTVPAAVATVVACWALYASFAVGTRGDLVFDRAAAVGFGILVLAAAVGAASGAVFRAIRRPAAVEATPSVPAQRSSPPVPEKIRG
ncbi:hypothetical protein MOQ72_37475 [Saccharopolyspora sp. K220]|uniref:hypothetical protein n=1 Tax=Saccharopolyspora soli TaxID=2926618 RepID=UPI001F57C4FD|nr:hypothetical protein [Saccharopolyspora soli]MCI2423125.1 hypothetical protein [Saccharopolyspora soli]